VVYGVWFDVLAGDDKSAWRSDLLTDDRVIELWDSDRTLGQWFPQQEEYKELVFGPLAWDIYFLYGPDATWGNIPSPLVSSGHTIISSRKGLERDITPLLEAN